MCSDSIYFTDRPPHTPGLLQFVWADYDQASVVFYCYNVTGDIGYNSGVVLWSRNTRRPSYKVMQKVHQLHDNGTFCVNNRRVHQITHTLGMFIHIPCPFVFFPIGFPHKFKNKIP